MADSNAVRVNFDAASVFSGLDRIAESAGEFVRPAAQAGAEVFHKEARQRAPVSEAPHLFYGKATKKLPRGEKKQAAYGPFLPGNLRDAIYQVFSADNSAEGKRAVYHVSWNRLRAPYAHMVEYGTSRTPAKPFLRPSYDARKGDALAAANDKFVKLMKNVLKGSSQ